MEQLNKRQLQAKETKDAIYAAVNSLVAEMPFQKIRIQDICMRANISLGSFYHYFTNKNDLLIDRYFRSNTAFKKLYEEKLQTMHTVDALQLFLKEMTQYTKTRLPDILRPYMIAYLENYSNWNKKEGPYSTYIIKKLIDSGFEKNEFKPGYTPDELYAFVICQMMGLIINQCLTDGKFLAQEAVLTITLDRLEALRA